MELTVKNRKYCDNGNTLLDTVTFWVNENNYTYRYRRYDNSVRKLTPSDPIKGELIGYTSLPKTGQKLVIG